MIAAVSPTAAISERVARCVSAYSLADVLVDALRYALFSILHLG